MRNKASTEKVNKRSKASTEKVTKRSAASTEKITKRKAKKKDETASQATEDGGNTKTKTSVEEGTTDDGGNARSKPSAANAKPKKRILEDKETRQKISKGKEEKPPKKEKTAKTEKTEKTKTSEEGENAEENKKVELKKKSPKKTKKVPNLSRTVFEKVENAQPAVVIEKPAVMKWTGDGYIPEQNSTIPEPLIPEPSAAPEPTTAVKPVVEPSINVATPKTCSERSARSPGAKSPSKTTTTATPTARSPGTRKVPTSPGKRSKPSKDKPSVKKSKGKKNDVMATQVSEDGGTKGTTEEHTAEDGQTISKTPNARSPKNKRKKTTNVSDEEAKLKARKGKKDAKESKDDKEKTSGTSTDVDKANTEVKKKKTVRGPRTKSTFAPTVFETVTNAQPAVVHEKPAVLKWTGDGYIPEQPTTAETLPPPTPIPPAENILPEQLPTPSTISPIPTMACPVIGQVCDDASKAKGTSQTQAPTLMPLDTAQTARSCSPPPQTASPADFYGGSRPTKDKTAAKKRKAKKKDVTNTMVSEDGATKGTVEENTTDESQNARTPTARSPNKRKKTTNISDDEAKLRARKAKREAKKLREAEEPKEEKAKKSASTTQMEKAASENEKRTPRRPRKKETFCATVFESVPNAQPAVVHEKPVVLKWSEENSPSPSPGPASPASPAPSSPSPSPASPATPAIPAAPAEKEMPQQLPTPSSISPIPTMASPLIAEPCVEPEKPKESGENQAPAPSDPPKNDGGASPPPASPADFYGGVAPSPKQ